MNILYIWDADYPWDVRVEKLCKAMISNGHSVHIAARNLKKRVEYENIAGLHVHRTKIWNNDWLNYFFSFPLFCSPMWRRFLDSIIGEHHIDIVIVRDLPLAIAGIWAGKRAKIPVVLDMAEDYVAMIKDIWRLRKFQGLNLLVRNPYFAKLVERYTFAHMDHILVVVDEARDVVLERGGNERNITVVSNTPDLEVFSHQRDSQSEILDEIKRHYSVIYTGGIQLGRGLQTVVEAIPLIIEKIPDFRFVVVGDGYAANRIKELIQEKGVEKYVIWVGWVNHDDMYDYIRVCKVGVIPHFVTEHVQTTIPNKIFDYMGCGIPVVTSDAGPMKKLLSTTGCGFSFKGGDAGDMARAIVQVNSSSEDLGDRGKRAVEEMYNWQQDEKRLLDVISKLA